MSDSDFDQDDLVLQELKSQEIKGLTPRGKMAVHELANQDQGAIIFPSRTTFSKKLSEVL